MAPPPAGDGGNSTAATLTRFFIFETEDLTTWTYKGEQVARDRAHALSQFYPDKDGALPQRVAVSENAFRPEPARAARPVMPPVAAAAAPPAEEPAAA